VGWVRPTRSRLDGVLFPVFLSPLGADRDVVIQWQNGNIAHATLTSGDLPLSASLEDALARIKCKALIMPTRTDQYFVVRQPLSSSSIGQLTELYWIAGRLGKGGEAPPKGKGAHCGDDIRTFRRRRRRMYGGQ
jgi:hypothetical protein